MIAAVQVTNKLLIGCAGWSLSRSTSEGFPAEGTHLERYAAIFRATEINSSFHRPHRVTTYQKWAASVGDEFRFAVKIPKTITHLQRLVDAEDLLETFLAEVSGLGDRLGCLLVQIPPSLEFDAVVAEKFFTTLRDRMRGDVFFEPRHRTWFDESSTRMLEALRIGRVAADPAIIPEAGQPGGWTESVYFRLHGSPQIYYSSYDTAYLDALVIKLLEQAREKSRVWCIFDNSIRGSATLNALYLVKKISATAEVDALESYKGRDG